MGLFDHLFKSKSPLSEEPSVETGGAHPADPAKRSDAAARSTPPHRADPSVFLHPKSFVPRGATPLTPPGKSGAVSGVRKPGAPAAAPAPDEIVLVLGDVLSRIPTPYLRIGPHDPKRELRFSINDLSSDIARGRAAVPLSRIAQLVPDIFVKEISADEDTEVRLPLQKLVEQIGLLRSRPHGNAERIIRPVMPPPVVETSHPEPAPEIRLEPAGDAAQTLEPEGEKLPDPLAPTERIIELKPVADAATPVVVEPEPEPKHEPESEKPAAADEITVPEVPAAISPETKPPEESAAAEPPRVSAPVPAVVEAPSAPVLEPAAETAPAPAPESAAPAPAPVAELAPPGADTSEAPESQKPAATASEPVAPASQSAPSLIPSETALPETVGTESGGERIHLSLAAILRECPREIIVGDLPEVPDNVKITLPFAPIDRQLVMGYVEISAARFVAALPFSYQKYFSAQSGVKVPIPLEEVFQNLPDPAAAAQAAAEPPVQILAPAEPGLHPPLPATLETSVPSAVFAAPAGEKPDPASVVAEVPLAGATKAEPAPSEAPSATALPPLDLPAFHYYVPPPPVVVSAEPEPPAAVTIAPEGPVETAATLAPAGPSAEANPPIGEAVATDLAAGQAPGAVSDSEAPPPAESPSGQAAASPVTPDSQLPETSEPQQPAEVAAKETPAPEPRSEGNSAAVFAEANQTIPAPQWARPFIVLPPPIFAFKPEPAHEGVSEVIEVKQSAVELTQKNNIESPVSSLEEMDALAPEAEQWQEVPEPLRSETPGTMGALDAGKEVVAPSIISIDFSEALLPPEDTASSKAAPLVEVTEIPPQTPGDAPMESQPAVAELAVSEPETATPQPVSIPSLDAAEFEFAGEEPIAEAAPAPVKVPQEAPPSTIVFMAEGRFTERPAPEFVDSDEDAEPEAAASVAPAAAESSLPEPSKEAPPTGTADDLEKSPAAAAPTVEIPSLASIEAEAPSDEDLTPLLSLPRVLAESTAGSTLPPPALPLRRFDQDALQSIFMTDEVLDLPSISRLAAQLPGVHACVIATRDQACTGGRLPEGFDLAALLGLAPRVRDAAGRMPIGSLKHFTLYGDQYSVSFFERNGLSLCAVHRPRSFVPGVREKLVAIADELSR